MKTLTLGNLLSKFVLLLAIGLAPVSAYCGSMTGTITSIVYNTGKPNFVFIYLSAPNIGAPVCATQTNRMTLDLTTQVGKAMYANLLALKLTSPATSITLIGSNDCAVWSVTENILYTML